MTPISVTPDLKTLAQAHTNTMPAKLELNWVENIKGKSALHIQPTKKEFNVEDEWIIIFNGIEFNDGEIEFDVLGKSNPPQSNFLGIAFHYLDDTTHDAVYFRPFNFKSDDPERKAHAVQYISHPDYRWFNLRQERPGEYEKPINPIQDGDDWFQARIVIKNPKISVFVNNCKEPCLVINELGHRLGSGIGLWCGPGQGGFFANIKISPL